MRVLAVVPLLALIACPPAPPPEEPAKAPACDVEMSTLSGSSWVWLDPNRGDKPNPIARVKFVDEGGTLHAKYTAKSVADVYDYTCAVEGGVATCLETDTHATAFCKAWAAAGDGTCDPAGVAAATGIPQAEFDKVAPTVNDELKKLSKAETEVQRRADNDPNHKIRGKILVALDKNACKLTLQDHYLTLHNKRLTELENVLGAGPFVKATEEYLFEGCKDAAAAGVPEPGQEIGPQAPGAIKVSAILPKDQKADPACTYTATVYTDWVKSQDDLAAAPDEKFGVRWSTDVTLTETGPHAVFFDRYKTCGGAKERIGFACAAFKVQ